MALAAEKSSVSWICRIARLLQNFRMLGTDWQAAVASSRKGILEEFGERVTKIGWRYRKKVMYGPARFLQRRLSREGQTPKSGSERISELMAYPAADVPRPE